MTKITARRVTALAGNVVLIAVMTVTTVVTAATAKGHDPAAKAALAGSVHAAGHTSGFGCGSPFGGPLDFKIVENNRHIRLVCTGQVENASGTSQRVTGEDAGYGCFIPSPDAGGVSTSDWFAQMSASGRVTLVCKG